jgi:ElaB/YqjD/DUF883 family membrane-anchored ribosome-binding protein
MDHTDTGKTAQPATNPFPTSGSHLDSPPGLGSGSQSASMDSRDPFAANAGDEMLDRIVQVAHEAIDRLAGTAAPHVHRLQEQFGHVGETFNLQASDVRATGEEWAESVRDTVREHPLVAVATAVALGMLLTRLTR